MKNSIFPDASRSAQISTCTKYRYQLFRKWDDKLPMVLFIMLNPSTADADNDDPTVKRCIRFAQDWGFGSLCICNLFAYRATNPNELKTVSDPVGYQNHKWIKSAALNSKMIVCAWGNSGIIKNLQKKLNLNILPLYLLGEIHCIDLSNDGTPKHPLYLKSELKPKKYKF